jgi:3-oxoacyl-[acyl-carrier protein] reductase
LESTDEDWLEAFKVNVLGVVHVCQAIIPYMVKAKFGRIVNISSVRGHSTGAGIFNTPYSTSKAAIRNLSISLAKEFAPFIAVNSVSPGFTNTDFAKTWNEQVWKVVNSSLVGRIGEPKEIGELLCFLVSDKASFITGQDFVVDGGLLNSAIK